jgi:DNA-binding MarR family transcriptional regulator
MDRIPRGAKGEKVESSRQKRCAIQFTTQEQEFLKDVWEHPTSTIVQRYHQLGLSPRRGTRLQKSLLDRELIIPSPMAVGHARIKILSLTGLGKTVLAIHEPDADRFGGPEHRYWKHRLAEHLRGCGYAVEQEVPTGGGKTIDLVATRAGARIAFEIETDKSDAAANISKCLDAGVSKIVVVATSVTVHERLSNILPRNDRVVLRTAAGVLAEALA